MGNLVGNYFLSDDNEEDKVIKKVDFASEFNLDFEEKLANLLVEKKLCDLDLDSLCKPPNMKDYEKTKTLQVDKDADAKDAFNLLIDNKIHSCPVYDSIKKEYIGLLDWQDFTSYLVQFYDAVFLNIRETEERFELKASQLCNYSGINPFRPIYTSDTLLDVFKAFRCQSGVHRCPVFDKSNPQKIIAVCSQSALIKWLAQNISALGSLSNMSLAAVINLETDIMNSSQKLGYVLSVNIHPKVINVLKLIVDTGVNGVAVVSINYKGDHKGQGQLVGNISASDLKYLVEENINKLNSTVEEFLSFVKEEKKKNGENTDLVTCLPSTTVAEILQKFVETHVHRIYVVDALFHVKAVVTLTDVIEAVILAATKNK